MPRFTVKDLLAATTLVAIGAGMLVFLFKHLPEIIMGLFPVLWIVGGACIGAGLFTPFKRPWTGVFVAVAIQTFLFVAFTLYFAR